MMHAVGQGALGIEIRASDAATRDIVRQLNCGATEVRCVAERAFMRKLEGGCSVPLGVFSSFENGMLELEGSVTSPDGSVHLRTLDRLEVDVESNTGLLGAERLGIRVAESLIEKGASKILDAIKGSKNE